MKQLFFILSSGILLLLVGCTTVETNNRLERDVIRQEREVMALRSRVSSLDVKTQEMESHLKDMKTAEILGEIIKNLPPLF